MLREAAFLLPPMCRAVPRCLNTWETVKMKVCAMGSVIYGLGEKSLGEGKCLSLLLFVLGAAEKVVVVVVVVVAASISIVRSSSGRQKVERLFVSFCDVTS